MAGMNSKLNAIIQRIRRTSKSRTVKSLAERYGYLPYMVARYLEVLGSKAETVELLDANEEPLPETIRCNDYLIDCRSLRERLESKGYILDPIPFLPHGFIVSSMGIGTLGSTHEYLMGYYYIQDPASMSVVYALDPREGELIVDMAAAPGGKSTQILQLTRDSSFLLAIEKNAKRIRSLRSNLSRMGFTSYTIIQGDSLHIEIPFTPDRILLDAPSTGEGIIRKDPKRKRSRTLEDLIEIHEIQYRMLRRAVRIVREGGVIVYSACTLAPEEGEIVIDRILGEFDNVTVEPLGLPVSPGIDEYFGVRFDRRVVSCGRFWPHRHGTEGFFICRLRKT